jgi:VCBS repeat-containing protein
VLGSSANVGHCVSGAFGVLTLNADGSYSYSNTNPNGVTTAGGVTEDLFNYTISNGHGGTTDAALSVLITSPNDICKTGFAGSTLRGGSGNYVLDGSAGNMHLTAGNQGQQWLIGGAGDVLSGGKSADNFMFSPGFGKETINYFNPTQDVIDLPQSMFANFVAVQADMHASGSNTIIMADANDVITLSHIAVTSLHAQNFHFLV